MRDGIHWCPPPLVKTVVPLVVVLVLCGGVIFFRMEQNAVKKSRLDDQHVREHNEVLKAKNDELKAAKAQLIKDEEEYVCTWGCLYHQVTNEPRCPG